MRSLEELRSIDGHDKSILHKKIVPPKTCNCRIPAECSMDSNCLKELAFYQATVTTEDNNPPQTYVGLTENSFKTRYSNHKTSFCNSNKRFSTELSKHIWYLRDRNVNFKVTWKILKQAAPYNPLQIDVTYASGSITLFFVNLSWPL